MARIVSVSAILLASCEILSSAPHLRRTYAEDNVLNSLKFHSQLYCRSVQHGFARWSMSGSSGVPR